MTSFITPPNHFGFKAKKIYGNPIKGIMTDCAIAYIEPNGGGPEPAHSHPHGHFFIVMEGEVTVYINGEINRIGQEEAIFVEPETIHSIHNESKETVRMVGITIQQY